MPRASKRLSGERRKRIIRELPPKKCTAHIAKTGAACTRWAVVGAGVCWRHGGGLPQVVKKADERIAAIEAELEERPVLAAMLAATPRRSPSEIIVDTLAVSDLLRTKVLDLAGAPPWDLELIERIEMRNGRTAQLAKMAFDAQLSQATLAEEVGRRIVLILEIAGARSGLDMSDANVRAEVAAAVRIEVDAGPSAPAGWAALEAAAVAAKAVHAARAQELREAQQIATLAEHRREVEVDVRAGRSCSCCGSGGDVLAIGAAPAERPVEPPGPSVSLVDDGRVNGQRRPPRRADEAVLVDAELPVRATAEVVHSLEPKINRCPGCGEATSAAGHQDRCEWFQAELKRRTNGGLW